MNRHVKAPVPAEAESGAEPGGIHIPGNLSNATPGGGACAQYPMANSLRLDPSKDSRQQEGKERENLTTRGQESPLVKPVTEPGDLH